MWGGGLLVSLLLINPFWEDLPIGFGLMLAAGFVGGHGTAAAIGETFMQHGWEEATTLAMTSATVGVVASIILGIFFIKIGSNRGHTSFLFYPLFINSPMNCIQDLSLVTAVIKLKAIPSLLYLLILCFFT